MENVDQFTGLFNNFDQSHTGYGYGFKENGTHP